MNRMRTKERLCWRLLKTQMIPLPVLSPCHEAERKGRGASNQHFSLCHCDSFKTSTPSPRKPYHYKGRGLKHPRERQKTAPGESEIFLCVCFKDQQGGSDAGKATWGSHNRGSLIPRASAVLQGFPKGCLSSPGLNNLREFPCVSSVEI